MSLFSLLKQNSRRALRDSWGKSIIALLITVGASLLLAVMRTAVVEIFVDPADLDPSVALHYGINPYFLQRFALASLKEGLIYLAFALVGLALIAPLWLGIQRWHYELIRGNRPPVSDIFRYFETRTAYFRSLAFELHLAVRTFLWALVFFTVPGGVLGASVFIAARGGEAGRTAQAMASVGLLLSGVLFLLAGIFYLAVVNRYFLAAYLIAEDDGLTVRKAIRASVSHTGGYRFSLLWYQLSFTGWFLLCIFIFPLLYVGPYFSTSMAMYARYIIEKSRFTPPMPTKEFNPAAQQNIPGQEEDPSPEDMPVDNAGADTPPMDFTFPQSNYPAGQEPPFPLEEGKPGHVEE